jgi:hypothetical protein
MKNTVIYIGSKNGSQYRIRQFTLSRVFITSIKQEM